MKTENFDTFFWFSCIYFMFSAISLGVLSLIFSFFLLRPEVCHHDVELLRLLPHHHVAHWGLPFRSLHESRIDHSGGRFAAVSTEHGEWATSWKWQMRVRTRMRMLPEMIDRRLSKMDDWNTRRQKLCSFGTNLLTHRHSWQCSSQPSQEVSDFGPWKMPF